MEIRIGCELKYEATAITAVVLQVWAEEA